MSTHMEQSKPQASVHLQQGGNRQRMAKDPLYETQGTYDLTPRFKIVPGKVYREAIIYIRVSMAREEMCSPELQFESGKSWCDRNEVVVVGVVDDLDLTGREFAKRKISQIIERVRQRQANLVVVWKFSRWGRNAELCAAHRRLLYGAGGKIASATEGEFDLRKTNDKFFVHMIDGMNEHFSDSIGDGWREAIDNRHAHGLPGTGRPRFGYMRCPDCVRNPENSKRFLKCKTCEGVFRIDPERGPALAEAYKMYVEGWSFQNIANIMRRRGVRSNNGMILSPAAWVKILDTGFAAGIIARIPREARELDETRNKKGTILTYDYSLVGVHPTLISMDTWNAYRERRLSQYNKKPAALYPKHPVTGIARCGMKLDSKEVCTATLAAKPRGGSPSRIGIVDFVCANRAQFHTCPGMSCRQDVILAAIRDWILRRATDVGIAEAAMQQAAERAQALSTERTLREMEANILGRMKKLLKGYTSGLILDEIYEEEQEEMAAELSAVRDQLAEMERVSASKVPAPEEFQGLLAIWDRLNAQELNAAIRRVISYVLVSRTAAYSNEFQFKIVARWEADPIKKLAVNPGNLPAKPDTQLDQ